MNIKEVLKYFGNQNITARILGIHRVSVGKWVKKGGVPPRRQLEIQKLTKGKLKAGL
ncbi:Cro/CI family transcriptional regulator [Caedibacter taeniospiralis]|uniref:Cro/CI family transcriptional regulator n=1 Tax=Caedibacter taeniospiralis TaxID=28907 RepID=UPI0037BF71D4